MLFRGTSTNASFIAGFNVCLLELIGSDLYRASRFLTAEQFIGNLSTEAEFLMEESVCDATHAPPICRMRN